MKLAILTANLGNFDTGVKDPFAQMLPMNWIMDFHRFTDDNFPPITGLTPRLQYRIPKLFGWEMLPDFDAYIWLDGGMSLQHPHSVDWFISKLEDADAAFFTHPWRKTMQEEVNHIEEYLQKGNKYITSRYKNGLHKEMLAYALADADFTDGKLYASTAFIYRNNDVMREALSQWWFYQSRYYTCDQVNLPYALFTANAKVNMIQDNLFKNPYVSLVSKHK